MVSRTSFWSSPDWTVHQEYATISYTTIFHLKDGKKIRPDHLFKFSDLARLSSLCWLLWMACHVPEAWAEWYMVVFIDLENLDLLSKLNLIILHGAQEHFTVKHRWRTNWFSLLSLTKPWAWSRPCDALIRFAKQCRRRKWRYHQAFRLIYAIEKPTQSYRARICAK